VRSCRLFVAAVVLAYGLPAPNDRAVAQSGAGTWSSRREATDPAPVSPDFGSSSGVRSVPVVSGAAPADARWLPPAGTAVQASQGAVGVPANYPAGAVPEGFSRPPTVSSSVSPLPRTAYLPPAPPVAASGPVFPGPGTDTSMHSTDLRQVSQSSSEVPAPPSAAGPALIADSSGNIPASAPNGRVSPTPQLAAERSTDNRHLPINGLGAQSPVVYLEKIGPATVPLGKPMAYEVVARNTGSVVVFNVHVEDELPSGAHFVGSTPAPDVQGEHLLWNLGMLEPGAERRIKIEMMPGAEGELVSRATATFSASSAVATRVTRPQLTVSVTGPQRAMVGDPAAFLIQVANVGTGPATNVVVHDNLPSGLWHEQGQHIDADIGTLAPGESKTLNLQATAVKVGPQSNEAVVTADEGIRATAQAPLSITEAMLALHVSAPHRRYLNREAEFTVEVSNPGSAPAQNVRVMGVLPEGLEFVSASDDAVYEAATRKLTWKLGTLASGDKRKYSLKTFAKGPGDLSSHAIARADRGLEAKSEATVHVEGIPALVLDISVQDDPIEVGKETTYEIRVRNQGTAAAIGSQIAAAVPVGMAARDAAGPTAGVIQGQQVVFEPLAKLAPGGNVIYRVRAVGQQPGDLRFKVQLTAEHLSQPMHEERSTRVYGD
jgi:uncharacterized repeat protein (TIGR01451 family)